MGPGIRITKVREQLPVGGRPAPLGILLLPGYLIRGQLPQLPGSSEGPGLGHEGESAEGGGAVKNVNGAAWSSAPAVWRSPELAGAGGRSPGPRAPFVPALRFVKGGGRGKNLWNLSFHGSPCCQQV